jgi:hypothetical protein
MTTRPPASSVCSLSEAPDAYRGYLAPAEIAAVLRRAADAATPAAAARLDAVLAGLPAPAAAPPAGFDAGETGNDTKALLDRLLPRIADDGLHACLQAIRATL